MSTTTKPPAAKPSAARPVTAARPAVVPAATGAAKAPTTAVKPAAPKGAGNQTPSGKKKKKEKRDVVALVKGRMATTLQRLQKTQAWVARWGTEQILVPIGDALKHVAVVVDELDKLPAGFAPVRSGAPKTGGWLAPGKTVFLRSKVRASYPEAFHGPLTVVRSFTSPGVSRIEVLSKDNSATMVPRSDLQRPDAPAQPDSASKA